MNKHEFTQEDKSERNYHGKRMNSHKKIRVKGITMVNECWNNVGLFSYVCIIIIAKFIIDSKSNYYTNPKLYSI